MIVENKDEISFEEFSAWMVGMIRGKGGAIPDLDDWKEIKKMMDKVAPTKEVAAPIFPNFPNDPPPFVPPYQPNPIWIDNTGHPPFNPGHITCGDTITTNELKLDMTTTTTAKEGDEPLYMYMDNSAKVGHETSGFVQTDVSDSAYGMAEAIASMESLSKQLRVGE